MANENESWGIVELMGHVTLTGRIAKPGEWGGLWQIDIPEGDSFRTEFFGTQSVYRVRLVSEEIARAYAENASNEVVEYNAPIVTRAEHEAMKQRASNENRRLLMENDELKRRLIAVKALPSGADAE